jgi:hypothetical protein
VCVKEQQCVCVGGGGNRLDLALSTWDRLASQGVDIGPIGSSALIKACARQMDLNAAKHVRLCVWGGGV